MRYALLGSLMACVLLSGLCGVAVAAEKKFNHYSIDLPGKCTATEKEGICNGYVRAGFLFFHRNFFACRNGQSFCPAVCRKAVCPA